MKLKASSPLAGALLTEKFCGLRSAPSLSELSHSQRNHLNTIKLWAKNNEYGLPFWQLFDRRLLKTINGISLKHRVSMASVALRWVLQQPCIGSAVVTTGVGRIDRSQSLREVFTFAFDDEDMALLEEAYMGGSFPTDKPLSSLEGEMLEGEDFLNLSDRRLWL